ncbi:hypothetical protein HFO09_09060 [Rhizobium laguerreae]|uniref:hypothetical protein n=1 Tax=Rhizobium laguerreae TaxID=1076926 RepID=UPI001C8FC33D|nr:hypothetical protein [Rhizobium laguerreae]MBY3259858.1 hypothetical protein [Rhizobium laguerreae]MBY3282871.1 hypothetical protein [Rhizobium laguerreae]MBY3289225.1 hypothetical protein [Rhizobium laguerreae]
MNRPRSIALGPGSLILLSTIRSGAVERFYTDRRLTADAASSILIGKLKVFDHHLA